MGQGRYIIGLTCGICAVAFLIWGIRGKINVFSASPPSKTDDPTATAGVVVPVFDGSKAAITLAGKDVTLTANSLGSFPQITVEPDSTIPVRLKLAPNTAIQQIALDGGQFANKKSFQSQQTDGSGNLQFQYQIQKHPGNYRVAVDSQGQRLIFNFWVGPPLTPRVGH